MDCESTRQVDITLRPSLVHRGTVPPSPQRNRAVQIEWRVKEPPSPPCRQSGNWWRLFAASSPPAKQRPRIEYYLQGVETAQHILLDDQYMSL